MKMLSHDEEIKQEFAEELLKNINSVYSLAYRLTGSREQAQDLAQEASLRAFRFYSKFERGTNFKAWILTILRNLFINDYRKRMREPLTLKFEDFESIEAYASLPEPDGFAEELFSEHVQICVDKLPEELRSVIMLFYAEGLAYKEIAQVMQCPIGTVMSRLYTAKQVLKQNLVDMLKKEKEKHGLPGN